MAFEIEHATYRTHLDQLRPFTGKWVLIRGTEIVGIYPSWDEVIEVAFERFVRGEYYITQIETATFLEFDLSPEILPQEMAA